MVKVRRALGKKRRGAMTLRGLRERLGISQGELAEVLGTSQPAVLKTERAGDPRLSTVRRYLEGLARIRDDRFDVKVVADIGDETVTVTFPVPETARSDTRSDPVEASTTDPTAMVLSAMAGPNEAAATRRRQDAWRLRAWNDPELERRWLDEGVISISKDEIGDLTTWPGDDAVATRLREALPERSRQAIGMFVTYWRYFREDMARADLVAVPLTGSRVAIGEITSDYRHSPAEPDERMRHLRSVIWERTLQRSDLDDDLRRVVNAPGTICRINAEGATERLSASPIEPSGADLAQRGPAPAVASKSASEPATEESTLDPPTTYPNPRNDNAWDNDAVHWLLDQPDVAASFKRGPLMECLRRQPGRVKNQPHRVEEAAGLARSHGVIQRQEYDAGTGKELVRLYRTDPDRPHYPGSPPPEAAPQPHQGSD